MLRTRNTRGSCYFYYNVRITETLEDPLSTKLVPRQYGMTFVIKTRKNWIIIHKHLKSHGHISSDTVNKVSTSHDGTNYVVQLIGHKSNTYNCNGVQRTVLFILLRMIRMIMLVFL